MKSVFYLPKNVDHECVAILTGLLEAAQAGELTGLVFGAALQNKKYYCDTAGSMHKNTVLGLGTACMLVAEIERKLQHEAIETMF